MSHLLLHHLITAHAVHKMHTSTGPMDRRTSSALDMPSCHKACVPGVQTRLSPQLVSEVEAVLGEHEADLELSQQRSPKPGLQGPAFPAQPLLDVINKGIQVQLLVKSLCLRTPALQSLARVGLAQSALLM